MAKGRGLLLKIVMIGLFLGTCYLAFRLILGGTTFASLERLPGERLLYEERELDVRRYGNGVTLHPWCRVQVTDRRLLIGQRGLAQDPAGDDQALLYALVPAQGQDSIAGGFQTLYCPPREVEVVERDGKRAVVFPLPSSSLHDELVIFTATPDSLRAAVWSWVEAEAE